MAQMLTCMDDLAGPPPEKQGEGGAAGTRGEGEEGGKAGAEGGRDSGPGGKAFQPHPHVIVIGATNRPDALDTALR